MFMWNGNNKPLTDDRRMIGYLVFNIYAQNLLRPSRGKYYLCRNTREANL